MVDAVPKKDSLESTFQKIQKTQLDYLTRKSNAELDLFKKFRLYYEQRSALEAEYAKNLKRLAEQCSVDVNRCNDLGYSNRSLYIAWNSYLEDIKKISEQHTSLSKYYEERVGENLKVSVGKSEASKQRCFDRLSKYHQEIMLTVKSAEKHRNEYYLAQTEFERIKNKMAKLNDKSRRRKPSKTDSDLANVGQELNELKEKYSSMERQVSTGRNLFLIELRKLTILYQRFITNEFPSIVEDLEYGIYGLLQNLLSTSICIELEDYENSVKILQAMMKEVCQVLNIDEHRRSFYACNSALSCPVDIQFEPCLSDTVRTLKPLDPNDYCLVSEARLSLNTLIRSQKEITELEEKLERAKNLHKCSTPNSFSDSTSASVRTSKASIFQFSNRKPNQPISSSQPVLKNLAEQIQTWEESLRKAETNRAIVEAVLNDIRHAGVNVDDITINDSSSVLSSGSRHSSRLSISSSSKANNDEIDFAKGEFVKVLENPVGKDWFKAQNAKGEVGLVPSNYIDCEKISKPSSSYSEDSGLNSNVVVRDNEILFWCLACFDYSSSCNEDLRFFDGDVIGVIDLAPNGVDDGFWKGRRLVSNEEGLLPSLMVRKLTTEEADKYLHRLGLSKV